MTLEQIAPLLDNTDPGEGAALHDQALVALLKKQKTAAFELVVQRHNRRLYRVARSILRDDTEAEDVVQEAYVKALSALERFRGESSLSTWLTRIVINEALGRRRGRRNMTALSEIDDAGGRKHEVKSWAMPPVSWPIASIFCDCRSCSRASPSACWACMRSVTSRVILAYP